MDRLRGIADHLDGAADGVYPTKNAVDAGTQ